MGKWCGLNFTDGLRYNHINGSVLRIFIIVAEVTPNVIGWVQIQGMCLNCNLLTHTPQPQGVGKLRESQVAIILLQLIGQGLTSCGYLAIELRIPVGSA